MVWVDIAIIALLAIYMLGGVIRGLNQEAYSVTVWVIGFMVAWFFCQDFAVILSKMFHTLSTRLAISFIALVSITLALGGLVNWLLKGSAKKTGLTLLNRLGGLLAGTAHGWVIVLVLVVVAGLTPLPKDRWWQQSKYLPPFQAIAILIKSTISTRLASSINYR